MGVPRVLVSLLPGGSPSGEARSSPWRKLPPEFWAESAPFSHCSGEDPGGAQSISEFRIVPHGAHGQPREVPLHHHQDLLETPSWNAAWWRRTRGPGGHRADRGLSDGGGDLLLFAATPAALSPVLGSQYRRDGDILERAHCSATRMLQGAEQLCWRRG